MSESLTEADLAATLRDSIANLESYVEARAAELTAQRTAALEAEHARTCAEYERELAGAEERRNDLVKEFRRQMDALERQVAQGAWLCRYLPEDFVRAAGLGRRCNPELLREGWIAHVDEAAAKSGIGSRATPPATDQK